jgi:hypothetical protein
MNLPLIQKVVDAVLYEGYILYPYRPTSAKNRQRWTFGGVYPLVHCEATGGAEPCHMQTQCLIEGHAETRLEVRVRFLHPLARDVGELTPPTQPWPDDREPEFKRVASLTVDGQPHFSWQEAVEREVIVADCTLGDLRPQATCLPFVFDASRELMPLKDGHGRIHGVLLRRQAAIRGWVEVRLDQVADSVDRLTVRIENHSAMDPAIGVDREEASLYSFASTHTILATEAGAFVSLIDPPEELKDAVAQCENQGAFPVLIGLAGARDTILSSPIILYDYPEVAPESRGNLYDSTEIDEILSLNILAMTDLEKREMAATDPRAAELLARTQALSGSDFMRLHGVLHNPASSRSDEAGRIDTTLEPPRLACLEFGGKSLTVGGHVRLHPKKGGEVMDLVLAGKTAVIEAIERDFDDRVHVAVTLDDDPGRDWGLERMPGHRFFFSPDEVEPLDRDPVAGARP